MIKLRENLLIIWSFITHSYFLKSAKKGINHMTSLNDYHQSECVKKIKIITNK